MQPYTLISCWVGQCNEANTNLCQVQLLRGVLVAVIVVVVVPIGTLLF